MSRGASSCRRVAVESHVELAGRGADHVDEQAIGLAATFPSSRQRRTQCTTVLIATSYTPAARRHERPPAVTELTTRSRRSSEYGLPIHAGLHLQPAS